MCEQEPGEVSSSSSSERSSTAEADASGKRSGGASAKDTDFFGALEVGVLVLTLRFMQMALRFLFITFCVPTGLPSRCV